MAYIIGLCGGIGSGKSAVSCYLEKKGYSIVDADIIAREVVKKGEEGLRRLIAHFGESILDKKGNLDREALGKLIFNEEKKRILVNTLLHPLIEKKIIDALRNLQNESVIFLVVPLFFEAGYERYTDEVFYIISDEEKRVERIQKRDNIPKEFARKKIATQMKESEVIKRFKPVVIENNSSLKILQKRIDELLKERDLEL